MIRVQYIHKETLKEYNKIFPNETQARTYALRVAHTGKYFVNLWIGDIAYAL